MSKGREYIVIVLLPAAITVSARAEVRLYFDRDNNTYNWTTAINHTISSHGVRVRSHFDGQSNLIKGGFNRWQESALTGLESEITIRKKLALVIDGAYTVNGLDRRRVKTTELSAGLLFKPTELFRIRPLFKAADKQRAEIETQLDERGLGFAVQSELARSTVKGITVDGDLSYERVNLSNIPWQNGEGHLNVTTGFWRFDTLSAHLTGNEAAKKYYSAGGKVEEIIRQIKQERNGVFLVRIDLPARLNLDIDGGARLSRYLYRQNGQGSSSRPQRDNYGRGGDYKITLGSKLSEFANVSAAYLWSITNEDFQGLELDQDTEKGELNLHGDVLLSPADSVVADMMFGVTSYSNPNLSSNLDNRDQKTIIFNGRYSHRFNRHFLLGVTGGASSFHQIYLSGARSANNGRNDTYIFSPYSDWKLTENLTVGQTFDIQANYITFDFDRKKVATKNRIFRRATSRTDLTIRVSDRLIVKQGYLYRYEDYGPLIWDDGWQQSVSWDRRRNGLETRLDYRPLRKFRLSPYFYWEKTGDYNRTVDPDSDLNDPLELRYLKDEQVKMFFELEMGFSWSYNRSLTAGFSHRLRKFMERPRETNDYVKISMEYMF